MKLKTGSTKDIVTILLTIGLVILGLLICIGIIRIIVAPYRGFFHCIMELFLLDCLFDFLEWVIDAVRDLWD